MLRRRIPNGVRQADAMIRNFYVRFDAVGRAHGMIVTGTRLAATVEVRTIGIEALQSDVTRIGLGLAARRAQAGFPIS